jgi:PPOX class probable F420-dependent enzyme
MPGYGIATGPVGMLAWSWAEARLQRSHDYWIATVWPDGRPHVMPVWGIWDGESLWFSSSPRSRKAKNLAADPRCTATTDNPYEPVILEGRAARVATPEAMATFTTATNDKYDTEYTVDFFADNGLFRLTPDWGFGLDESDFPATPTRWRF